MNKKALIVVDAQYDFMPVSKEDYENGMGGALAVKEGDQIIPVINELLKNFDLVIFTKDWHPIGMNAFASSHKSKKPFDTYEVNGVSDTLWPDHCVQNTMGAEIHKDIDFSLIKGDFYIFKKGLDKNCHPYSGFGAEGLLEFLQERKVEELVIVGLATDFCVKDTVLDSVKYGFKTTVIWDGCRGILEDLTSTLDTFFDAGVNVTDLEEFLERK
jgi:nicotinamidase/pyrazinamidase